jgi:probable O-glycosylation ligase (exosortase A-associated)
MSIRDIVLFALIFGALPFVLRHPYIGAYLWAWVSIMNPHRLTWGAAFDFQFAQIIAIATFAGMLFTKDERRWKAGPEIYLLLAFIAWVSITTLQAIEPVEAANEWKRVIKIQLMGLVTLVLLHTRTHIQTLVWILALSIAFYGVKGGLFTIITGGQFRVWGPEGSYIEDNNALALATVMAIPLLYYLLTQVKQRWIRAAFIVAILLCVFSALGSQSRGALVAIAAMGAYFWWKSRAKFTLGVGIGMLGVVLLIFMPESWMERMETIAEYKHESSASARLHAWEMLYRIANDRPLGAGFDPYSKELWAKYMPEWHGVHSAHSIYFEVLGEHGWFGLALYLLMWLLAWRCGRQVVAATRHRQELQWANGLATMIQVSLIGYFVGGAFQNLAYWDLPYYEIILLVLMRDYIRRQPATAASVQAAAAPGTAIDNLPPPQRSGER